PAAARVREEPVLALPAAAVARVVGVDEDVPAPRVERRAVLGGLEAVDALALVLEPAVQVVVLLVDPVDLDDELGQVAGPVREVHLDRALREGGAEAEWRQQALPLLDDPVRAVR